MQRDLKHLVSFPFLLCLGLLIINDLWLKDLYHNVLTGKLSDFCGLFIFLIFWTVLFPKRQSLIFFLSALLFVFWKSQYSQSFITIFSDNFYPITRVIDITDLYALSVLPVAWYVLAISLKPLLVNPNLAAAITFISFCATSIAQPYQQFDQPQYVLFHTTDTSWHTKIYEDEMQVFNQGNLQAVYVEKIMIESKPPRDDDFQKNKVLKDLDSRLLKQLNINKSADLHFSTGYNQLTFTHDKYKDIASFKGSRLHGKFKRYDLDNRLLIDGFYKNGLEDSVWNIRDSVSKSFSKITFINGERTLLEIFNFSTLISSNKINTRKVIIRNKQFQIALMLTIATGLLMLIIRNFKSVYPAQIKFSGASITGMILSLPLVILLLHHIITELIPDPYSSSFFEIIRDLFLIYLTTVPLLILIFLVIKIRKSIDILWYCFILSILYTVWQEILQLNYLAA